jgi:broad specificity phosphatase PhoE
MTLPSLPRLFLARHGDTAWTDSHQKTGRTDLLLNERGEAHARQIGVQLSRFAFRRIFTSPLQRASRTCELAGFAAGVEVDPSLIEWDYGRFEGKRTSEILEERPGWELYRDGCSEGESPGDVAARADQFIARVHQSDGDVLAFSSGHIIRMIAARWLGLPPVAGRLFYCDPASVGVLGFEHSRLEEPVIRLWNYVAHPRD